MSLEKHTTSSTAETKSSPPLDDGKQVNQPVGQNGAAPGSGGGAYGPLSFAPHTAEASKVLSALASNQQTGLTDDEAAKRLTEYGPNRIKPPKKPSVLGICLRQIGNAMTLVLSELIFRTPSLLFCDHLPSLLL